jgi:alpha-L-fucosidase
MAVKQDAKVTAVLLISLIGASIGPHGRDAVIGAEPSPAKASADARRWFEDAKFGLFIHWGLYSLLGKGEWVMERDKLPIAQYEKLAPQFNPTEFDADEWVKTAKAAGARYITVTAKHHDGFCLFESSLSRYDVADATPYGKDPIKALANACHKHGVKLFLYYSLLDWHHPDYAPLGKSGHASGREPTGDWSKYIAYYQGQVRELCTNYGEIGGVWLDGWWDRPDADWDLAGTYKIIHDVQPGALVGNNHHVNPMPGEDFQILGKDLAVDSSAGSPKVDPSKTLPREFCLTINRSWAHVPSDREFKTPEQLIHALLGAAGRGANLLLNVGPKPDGTMGPECIERLGEIGKWLDRYGESIYETREGPVPPQPWGVSVRKRGRNLAYFHLIHPSSAIKLPIRFLDFDFRPYGKTEVLKDIQSNGDLVIEIPEKVRMPIDTIITVTPEILDR